MKIEITETRGVKVVHLAGEFDEPEHFEAALDEAFDEGIVRAVLNLKAVGHINSAALNALVRITAQANTRGGGVVLVNPTPFVSGVLEATRLNEFLHVYPTVDEAVDQFGL